MNDRRSIPTNDTWLTTTQALELIRANFRCSEGRAENLLRKAIGSGDVRLQERTLLVTPSGKGVWYSNRVTPTEAASGMELRISEPDLRAWISAQAPAPLSARRYATDDDLVAEGIAGIEAGTWPNALKAAEAVAARAEGNYGAAVDRLRRKIRKGSFGD